MEIAWTTLLIWAAVLTLAFMLLGMLWGIVKKFIKIWLIFVIVLVAVKLMHDAGWIA